jgi:hypothetical protein
MNGLLSNPVISGLLAGGPNAIRAQADQARAALAPRGGGGMSGAPGAIMARDTSMSDLGSGLAGLGQGLSAIGAMRDKAKQREAFEAAVSQLPPEQQAAARLNPEAFAKANADALFRAKETAKPVVLGQGQVLVDPVMGRQIAAGLAKPDEIDLKGSAETGFYTVQRGPDGKPTVSMVIPPKSEPMTSLQKDFGFARKDGYKGSFTDFVRETRSTAIERAPAGYAYRPDGSVAPIPGGPEDPNAPAPAPAVAITTPAGARVGELGVPVPDVDPFAGLTPTQRASMTANVRQEAIKKFSASREAVEQANTVNERLGRFVQLLDEGLETGPMYKFPGAQTAASALNPAFAEALSIVDMMTPLMRQGLPGAASDRDVAMFRGATVGVDKAPQANRNIAAGLMASRQNLIERDQFEQAYFDQNKHLQGADRAWQKYLNANPIFDHDATKGSYVLNPNRVDWRDYFVGSNAAPAPAGGSPSSSIPPPPPGFSVVN